MKTIRITLFIIIVIGIIMLLTQKLWVPGLVNQIILRESLPSNTAQQTQAGITLKDGRQCYTYNHEATKTEPYTVNETIDITIKGNAISGSKTGNQKGPDMTNGYTGTITGTLDKNIITDIFAYTIEGSSNKEEEVYRTNKTGIEKLQYPLTNDRGILVPDTTKEFKILQYARVGCTASN